MSNHTKGNLVSKSEFFKYDHLDHYEDTGKHIDNLVREFDKANVELSAAKAVYVAKCKQSQINQNKIETASLDEMIKISREFSFETFDTCISRVEETKLTNKVSNIKRKLVQAIAWYRKVRGLPDPSAIKCGECGNYTVNCKCNVW